MFKSVKIYLFVLLLNIVFSDRMNCAFERTNGGARAEALGGAFTACANDYNSIFYNPAGLSELTNNEVSFFYMIPYGIKELGIKCFAFVLPVKIFGFGIMSQQMGTDLYRESQLVFSAGMRIYKGLSLGINSKLLNLRIQGYGSRSLLGVDIGMLYDVGNDLKFGAFFNNVNNPCIGKTKEKIAKICSIGISKKLISGLTLNLDMSKYNKYPVIVRFGGEMHLKEQFQLRFGISDNPTKFSGGFGVEMKNLSFDYSASNHIILGLTNLFSITLKIK